MIEALEQYQRLSTEVLDLNRDDPEAGVKGLVALHLSWTEENPDRARMVSRNRNAAAAGAAWRATRSQQPRMVRADEGMDRIAGCRRKD